ncbi:hypothetical protein [Methanoregula sp.]|uniref:hypothetical protein n=1 Tax=Methanoregula sp. TaxID=2052170 RepID=UPI003C7268B8
MGTGPLPGNLLINSIFPVSSPYLTDCKCTAYLFAAHATGAFAALIYAFVLTYILAILADNALGLRVTEEEYAGLDISQHGERA